MISEGHMFTWSNKQGALRVFSKTNHVLIYKEAIIANPDIKYDIFLEDVSDHTPILGKKE